MNKCPSVFAFVLKTSSGWWGTPMNNHSFGYAGSILRIDLNTQRYSQEPTEKYARRFLGGRGINQWILLNKLGPWVTPFEPANLLCFGAGALVGTMTPGASRLSVDSKNSLTEGIGSGNAGGWFASEMKFAGYDNIIIYGRARQPTYLFIDDDSIHFKPATTMWGKTTRETVELIEEDIGSKDVQIACIGPAGENLVRPACIIVSGTRAVGRCGLGAIMGSKNLKAIAVRGTKGIELKDSDAMISLVSSVTDRIRGMPSVKLRKNFGTPAVFALHNRLSGVPYKNFDDEYCPDDISDKISAETLRQIYTIDSYGCISCPTSCGHRYSIGDGPYAGTICHKFEANSMMTFGGKLAIDDPAALLKAHEECCQLGLDTDNTGGAIAWAIDSFQHQLLSKADTDGLYLDWGDHKVVIELIRMIAYREGFGGLLAEGSYRASQIIGKGSEDFSFTVKGQDLIEGIRSCKGWALGVVVSQRGATHTRGAPYSEYRQWSSEDSFRVFGVETAGNPTTYEGKARIVAYYDAACALWDSLGVCFILGNWAAADGISFQELARFYSFATGIEFSEQEIMKTGERIHNVEKMFNVYNAGFTRLDDYPPRRLMEEPIKSGPLKGEVLTRKDWDQMLDEYYSMRGWDKETSWPTEDTLRRIDLLDCIDILGKSKERHKAKRVFAKISDIFCSHPS
jgi:aldehyde:ferredoxin oxidoreductase